jgi:hypothetical protein
MSHFTLPELKDALLDELRTFDGVRAVHAGELTDRLMVRARFRDLLVGRVYEALDELHRAREVDEHEGRWSLRSGGAKR